MTSGGISTSGAFVPVIHHAINNPTCDCHVHFAPSNIHKQHRAINSSEASGANSKPHGQRTNGVIGCVHHHMNGVATAWQSHAYTLPYMPASHLHQMRQGSTKAGPRTSQHASRHSKGHQKSPRQHTSPKTDVTTSSS